MSLVIHHDFELKKYNTFAIDSCAQDAVIYEDESQLNELIRLASSYEKFLIIGAGSNLILPKKYVSLVILMQNSGIKVYDENDDDHVYLVVEAGTKWQEVVNFSCENNLCGIENLTSIPGKMGAAVVQNIGAYSQEIKDTLYEVEGVFLNSGKRVILNLEECSLAYRDSIFKRKEYESFLILNVTLRLSKTFTPKYDYPGIKKDLIETILQEIAVEGYAQKYTLCEKSIQEARKYLGTFVKMDNATHESNVTHIIVLDECIDDFDAQKLHEFIHPITMKTTIDRVRSRKIPSYIDYPNAGSYFKNPIISVKDARRLTEIDEKIPLYALENSNENEAFKTSAAYLIDKCGLKGFVLGNAQISSKHPLILVNHKNATQEDILKLEDMVNAEVYRKWQIHLEREPVLIR